MEFQIASAKKELLLEGTNMLGRPRMVDEDSLANAAGPVKMLFHSQALERMPKAVMLFAKLQGFRINVLVDNSKLSLQVFGGEDKKKDDEKDDDEDGREQTEEQSISDHHWKRGRSKDKAKAIDKGTSSLPAKGVAGAAMFEAVTPPPAARVSPVPPPAPNHQKEPKKPGSKSSMGSSSVPLLSALDQSATKPTSAPAKFNIQPVPFNQYRSNLLDEKLLAMDKILQPEPISMTIILDKDSAPDSDSPDPEILKCSKLSSADREEVGWESPEDWEYDNETLAQKIAKLKKKQDGEVDNPPANKLDSTKEAAGAPGVSNVKKSGATVSPIMGARASSRCQGSQGESILKKATKRAAARVGALDPPPPHLMLVSLLSLSFWMRIFLLWPGIVG
jgi:hypothetical protein